MEANANLSIFTIGDHAKELNAELYGSAGANPLFDIRVKEGESTTFIIRMVPYIKDIKNSKVTKFFYAIPAGDKTVLYDSMTTFNNPAMNDWKFCPISDVWKELNKSVDPNIKAIAEKLRRQTSLVHYIQVIACPAKPELNGKFMPFKMPIELDKALRELANPNEAQKALGKTGITAMDLFKGVNIECTILGQKHNASAPVMRKWTVLPDKQTSELQLPLGPNNTMVDVSKLDQQAVIEYFEANQPINLLEAYGYKAPNFDADLAAHAWVMFTAGFVPGIAQRIDDNFPHVVKHYREQNVGGMAPGHAPIETVKTSYGTTEMTAGNPMLAQQPSAPATENAAQAPATENAAQAPATENAAQAPATENAAQAPASENAAPTVETGGIAIP